MSVRGTLCALTSSHETFRPVVDKPRLAKKLYAQLLENSAQHILDIRPFRQEPRAM